MGALNRSHQQVRSILAPFDLLICLGADVLRMSVCTPLAPLHEGMPVIQIGERDWEVGKNSPAEIAIKADIKETLQALLPVLHAQCSSEKKVAYEYRLNELKTKNWIAMRKNLRKRQER